MSRVLPIFLVVVLITTAHAQLLPRPQYHFENNTPQLKAYVDSIADTTEPGFALAVLLGDSVLYQTCTGVASMQTQTPITPQTMFYTASIGKTFTSAAVLTLYDKGKLKLEDPLAQFFPDFPPFAQEITLHNLLDHTSGLPDYYDTFGEGVDSLSNSDILDYVTHLDSLEFPPGLDYAYSNTAYVLLAIIIEEVSGMSYADFLSRTFFEPLGMTSTIVYDASRPHVPSRAVGYVRQDSGFVKSDYTDITVTGSGGIYSNLEDMERWALALRSNQVLKPSLLSLALNPPVTISGKKSYMAMGWFDETFGRKTPEVEGIRSYAAIGVLRGFRAIIQFFPDYDLSYVLLSNDGDFPIRERKIASTYLKKGQ
jgi:CubicO group peptidase (beta-lactamase class C family)